MRWTPLPPRALRYTGSVLTRVLPSPVFISATQPKCSAAPPMSWTSKCRWPMTRLPASRVAANASMRRSSTDSPRSIRSRNSTVLCFSSSSLSAAISASWALMSGTSDSRALTLRPSPMRRTRSRTPMAAECKGEWLGLLRSPLAADRLLEVEQLLADGVDDGLHAGVEVQLLEDVAHVVLDRVLRDVELVGDLTVREALSHELEHLELAVGQLRRRDLLLLVGAAGERVELLDELRGHRRADQRLALHHGADRVGDLLDGDLLQQVAGGAGLDRLVEIVLLVGDGQHEDLHRRHRLGQPAGGLDAADARHAHIHEQHVRRVQLGLGDGVLAVLGLADDLDALLELEDLDQASSEEGVVIDDEHADGVVARPLMIAQLGPHPS